MRPRAAVIAVLALTLTACGPAAQKDKKVTDQESITKLVDDLASAGQRGQADKICNEILAKQLVDELKAAGGNCIGEIERAIKDASDYDLRVESVKVTGNTATAQVRQGESKTVATFAFVKQKDGWRASALGS